tara:strand:+ start:5195 stop:5629 length:435 start_codon:yes stop_codon:yes gene_type:complete
MALIGKWTKIEQVASETEKQLVTIKYPSAEIMGAEHPDINKADTKEEIEVPKIDIIETVYDSVYSIVHSINSWKQPINGKTETLVNICYRVYNSKEDRLDNYNSFIYENHLISQKIDYTTNKSDIEQSYDLVNSIQGFDELLKD